jgi:hypothetical protein
MGTEWQPRPPAYSNLGRSEPRECALVSSPAKAGDDNFSVATMWIASLNQLFGGNSIGLFCLPVLNSNILRSTPGAIAEIGLTRITGWAGVPTTS